MFASSRGITKSVMRSKAQEDEEDCNDGERGITYSSYRSIPSEERTQQRIRTPENRSKKGGGQRREGEGGSVIIKEGKKESRNPLK